MRLKTGEPQKIRRCPFGFPKNRPQKGTLEERRALVWRLLSTGVQLCQALHQRQRPAAPPELRKAARGLSRPDREPPRAWRSHAELRREAQLQSVQLRRNLANTERSQIYPPTWQLTGPFKRSSMLPFYRCHVGRKGTCWCSGNETWNEPKRNHPTGSF